MVRTGKTVQLNASIPVELMAKLRTLALKEKRTVSNMVALLLATSIERFNKK